MKDNCQSKSLSLEETNILKNLFLKAIDILQKCSLFEEAMIFSLALPLENYVYKLIDNGIAVGAIS